LYAKAIKVLACPPSAEYGPLTKELSDALTAQLNVRADNLKAREIANHFPQIIPIFIPPTFTGQLQALDVKFFGPFKQKLRGIQLNNWVKQFVHGTKETKIEVPSVKASRWNMLRSLHETLKESRPAAIATGEFMRSTMEAKMLPSNPHHIFVPIVPNMPQLVRQCSKYVKKGDEPVYVYPLFTLYGQTPDFVIGMRGESKPTPKHLPAYVRKEALKMMPDYEALLSDNDPSAVNEC
jgi:hypothetical protein